MRENERKPQSFCKYLSKTVRILSQWSKTTYNKCHSVIFVLWTLPQPKESVNVWRTPSQIFSTLLFPLLFIPQFFPNHKDSARQRGVGRVAGGKTNSFQNRCADFCNETKFVTVIYWAPKASMCFPASDIWTLKNWQSLYLEPEILVLIWVSIRV
jgi:hypothetical protein